MPRIAFGLRLPTYVWEDRAVDLDTLSRFAERAEQLGFENLWVLDHLLVALPSYRSTFHEPLVVLSMMAARTSRIRLGTSAVVLPLRNPAIFAKAIASLDHLSGGRVDVGVGVGWHEGEFAAAGIRLEERGRRADEYLAVLRRLWTGAPVTFEGRYCRFRDTQILPRTVQRPHPPIWVAGGSVLPPRFDADPSYQYHQFRKGPPNYEPVYRRIAAADGWLIIATTTPELIQKDWEGISRHAVEQGRDPRSIRRAQNAYLMVTDDIESAKRAYQRFTGKALDDWALKGTYLIGPAERIVEKIAERVELGIDQMILTPVTFDLEQLDTWAARITSKFQ